jgi:hypothetical protein
MKYVVELSTVVKCERIIEATCEEHALALVREALCDDDFNIEMQQEMIESDHEQWADHNIKAVVRGTYDKEWVDWPRKKLDLERDFYTVRDDGTIELRGWMEERDTNWDGFYDDDMPRYTLVTGDWPDVYDTNTDVATWALPYEHYEKDMHYEDAVRFMRGYWGTHLPMSDVDKDTPAGYYWCYFNEEPAFN